MYLISDGLGDEEQKRMSKFVRIGKNKELLNDDIFKRRLSNFVRIGRQSLLNDLGSEDVKRRMSSFVRIGRNPELNEINDVDDANGENVKRRMSSFVRIGKSVNTEGKENGLDLETDVKEQNVDGLQ